MGEGSKLSLASQPSPVLHLKIAIVYAWVSVNARQERAADKDPCAGST